MLNEEDIELNELENYFNKFSKNPEEIDEYDDIYSQNTTETEASSEFNMLNVFSDKFIPEQDKFIVKPQEKVLNKYPQSKEELRKLLEMEDEDGDESEINTNMGLILESIKQDDTATGIDYTGLRNYYNKQSALVKVRTRQKMTNEILDEMSYKASSKRKKKTAKEIQEKTSLFYVKQVSKHNSILKEGISRVWREDSEYQKSILTQILSEDRAVCDWMIPLYLEYFEKTGMFYNPTSNYMIEVFGAAIQNVEYGVFTPTGVNRYERRLMMPLEFFDETICGFVGYSAVNTDKNIGKTIKYLYPDKSILKKGKVMFITREELAKSNKDGYICITDGLFDKITLQALDINAGSCCGSAITSIHKIALNQVKKKIIIPDNDPAGTSFLNKFYELYGTDCKACIQTEENDIDEYLRSGIYTEQFLDKFEQWEKSEFKANLYCSKERRR